MQDVHITRVRCESPSVSQTKRYYLKLLGESSKLVGVAKTKSDHVKCNEGSLTWQNPFGGRFTFTPTDTTPVLVFVLALRKQRHLVRDEKLGLCTVDMRIKATTSEDLVVPILSEQGVTLGSCFLAINVSSTDPIAHTQQVDPDAAQGSVSLPTPALVSLVAAPPNAWDSLLTSLKSLGGVVMLFDEVAKIHPWLQFAWGVVSVAYKVIKTQSDRDESVRDLVLAMAKSCDFAQDAHGLVQGSPRHRTLVQKILEQVVECAYFIRDYIKDGSFAARLRKHLVSWSIDTQIAQYLKSFQELQAEATSNSVLHTHLIMDSIKKTVQEHYEFSVLSGMQYTSEAQPDTEDVCLPGTRTEVIEAIMQWATGADSVLAESGYANDPRQHSTLASFLSSQSSRVLWICGVAGTGKSAIWRTIASRLEEINRLGAQYVFSANHAAAKPSNLFATVARKLADHDHVLKGELVKSIRNNTDLRETKSCIKQFKSFIVGPATNLPTIGEIFILIDAFDESADIHDRSRKDVLDMLTREAHTIPSSIRIIVTSRKEPDVIQALQPPPEGVDVLFMDDVPTDLTSRDITSFVKNALQSTSGLRRDQIDAIIAKAGSSFQWASTACRFITKTEGGLMPAERLDKILQAEDLNLDELYARILGVHFNSQDPRALNRLHRILGCIMSAPEPLAFRVLNVLIPKSPDRSPYNTATVLLKTTLPYLSSLLSGTHSEDTGISPLHPSFREFICDSRRSNPFTIIIETSHLLMARGCLFVMERGLRFNLCRLPTSNKANRDIENIDALVKEHIPPPLSYACRHWAYHVSRVPAWPAELIQEVDVFFKAHFLWWLESMSVMQASFQDAMTSFDTAKTPPPLIPLIQDARCFASTFALPITQSAPHVYLSALPFTPESSFICDEYSAIYRNTATVMHGRLKHWSNSIRVLEGHRYSISRTTASLDGLRVVAISGLGDSRNIFVRSWDAQTGESIGDPRPVKGDDVHGHVLLPGGTVIMSDSDGVHLWDANDSGNRRTFHGSKGYVMSADISRDGTRIVMIVVAASSNVTQIWNVQTGELVSESVSLEHVSVVAVSPDGAQFVSGSTVGAICLQDASSGQRLIEPWTGHSGSVGHITAVSYSPHGQCFLSSSEDMTVRLWNASTGDKLGRPLVAHQPVTCAVFTRDGSHIAAGCKGGFVYMWDVATGDLTRSWATGHARGIRSLTFVLDEAQLVTDSADNTLRWWDIGPGSRATTADSSNVHTDAITCVAFSPDGEFVMSGSSDLTLRLWNTKTGNSAGGPLTGFIDDIDTMAFSLDGLRAIAISGEECWTWDVHSGTVIREPLRLGEGTKALTSDKTQVAHIVAAQAQFWDLDTGEIVRILPLAPLDANGADDDVESLIFSPDGAYLLLVISGSNRVCLCSTETGHQVGDFWTTGNTDDEIVSVIFSSNGERVMAHVNNEWTSDALLLWEVKDGVLIKTTRLDPPFKGAGGVVTATLAPDGKRVVANFEFSDRGTTVFSFDGDSDSEPNIQAMITDHSQVITALAFSPDGIQVVSGSADCTLRLWDASRMSELLTPGPRGRSGIGRLEGLPLSPQRPKTLDAIRYPEALFPSGSFTLRNGWIVGPKGEMLIWIPPAHRAGLHSPKMRVLGTARTTELDFSQYVGGDDWSQCYKQGAAPTFYRVAPKL